MAKLTVPIHVDIPDNWVELVVERLRNDPEAAWVEVVRCKECKFWDCPGYCVDFMTQDENGYCSWAKRRTDE